MTIYVLMVEIGMYGGEQGYTRPLRAYRTRSEADKACAEATALNKQRHEIDDFEVEEIELHD